MNCPGEGSVPSWCFMHCFRVNLPVQLWMTEFIDQILIKGDHMFLHGLTNQLILDTSSLLVSHLPVLVFTGIESSIHVAYEPPFFGSCLISFESHLPYWSLSDALMNTFMISWYAICVLEGYMIAIIKTRLQLQDFFTLSIVTLVTPRVGPLVAMKELQF